MKMDKKLSPSVGKGKAPDAIMISAPAPRRGFCPGSPLRLALRPCHVLRSCLKGKKLVTVIDTFLDDFTDAASRHK